MWFKRFSLWNPNRKRWKSSRFRGRRPRMSPCWRNGMIYLTMTIWIILSKERGVKRGPYTKAGGDLKSPGGIWNCFWESDGVCWKTAMGRAIVIPGCRCVWPSIREQYQPFESGSLWTYWIGRSDVQTRFYINNWSTNGQRLVGLGVYLSPQHSKQSGKKNTQQRKDFKHDDSKGNAREQGGVARGFAEGWWGFGMGNRSGCVSVLFVFCLWISIIILEHLDLDSLGFQNWCSVQNCSPTSSKDSSATTSGTSRHDVHVSCDGSFFRRSVVMACQSVR